MCRPCNHAVQSSTSTSTGSSTSTGTVPVPVDPLPVPGLYSYDISLILTTARPGYGNGIVSYRKDYYSYSTSTVLQYRTVPTRFYSVYPYSGVILTPCILLIVAKSWVVATRTSSESPVNPIGDQLRLILPISGGHSSNLPMRLLCPSILPIDRGHPSIVPTGGGRSSIVPIR